MAETKQCTRCNRIRPHNEFYARGQRLQSWCKECMNAQRTISRANPVQRCYEAARILFYHLDRRSDEEKLERALQRIARERRNWPMQGITITGGVVRIENGKVVVKRA